MIEVGIAKIIKRIGNAPFSEQVNHHNIEDAKEWCKECIALRLKNDSLYGELDKIDYTIKEVLDIHYWPPLAYRVEARLKIG